MTWLDRARATYDDGFLAAYRHQGNLKAAISEAFAALLASVDQAAREEERQMAEQRIEVAQQEIAHDVANLKVHEAVAAALDDLAESKLWKVPGRLDVDAIKGVLRQEAQMYRTGEARNTLTTRR